MHLTNIEVGQFFKRIFSSNEVSDYNIQEPANEATYAIVEYFHDLDKESRRQKVAEIENLANLPQRTYSQLDAEVRYMFNANR